MSETAAVPTINNPSFAPVGEKPSKAEIFRQVWAENPEASSEELSELCNARMLPWQHLDPSFMIPPSQIAQYKANEKAQQKKSGKAKVKARKSGGKTVNRVKAHLNGTGLGSSGIVNMPKPMRSMPDAKILIESLPEIQGLVRRLGKEILIETIKVCPE